MTKNELVNAYFEWMCQLVYDRGYCKRLSYRKLLARLHDTAFAYSVPMDGNRMEDGIDLRYRFGRENGYRDAMIAAYLDDTMICSPSRKQPRYPKDVLLLERCLRWQEAC